MISLPNRACFKRALRDFQRHEKRDAMYAVASYWVNEFWDNSYQLSSGLGVFLLTWNQACYRYGSFDFDNLAACIDNNRDILNKVRHCDFKKYSGGERKIVTDLFDEFQRALRSPGKEGEEKYSPVGTVKALHLLAPRYFPLWDNEIAIGYGCRYYKYDRAEKYLRFTDEISTFVDHVTTKGYIASTDNVLKKIDEYNYVTITLKKRERERKKRQEKKKAKEN